MNSPEKRDIILLVNLGSPDELSTSAIRAFLRKFLSDRRVVNLPKLLWYPILYGIILPLRSVKLLKQYRQIWLEDSSPLVYYTKLQAEKLARYTGNIEVRHAFSYSTPTIDEVLDQLHKESRINKLTIIPLYPQFSSTTTLPVFDAVSRFYRDKYHLPEMYFVRDYFANVAYINVLAKSITDSWSKNGRGEKLVFSFHGLPEVIIKKGDTYYEQCVETTRLVAEKLGLNANEYVLAFQSRFGSQKWLGPATIKVVTDLGANGVKSIDLICPGFVSDCLETLEEVAIINKAAFIDAGGVTYRYIACLNDTEDFIQVLYSLAVRE